MGCRDFYRLLNDLFYFFRQSIQFSWDPPEPQLNKTTCQMQRGQSDGYFVELYGLDPWAPEGLIVNKSLSQSEYIFIGRRLSPYSHYSLLVYVKNKNGLYNRDMVLNITARTKPYIPNVSEFFIVKWLFFYFSIYC